MADVIKITDGTESIDLYYDPSGFEMLESGNDFGVAKHNNTYHESVNLDGKMLVRHSKDNREWGFKLAVRSTSNSDLLESLGALNRLVERARSHQLTGSGNNVYLHIQLDGASQATYYDVIDIDYSRAAFFNYYNLRAKELIFGDGLSLTVITKPIGYGDLVTLCNELGNPHFLEDGNSDGLADCWNEVNKVDEITDETTHIDEDVYLIGGRSQNVIITNGNAKSGIISDMIIKSAGVICCYAWVKMYTAGDDIALRISGNSSGTIATQKLSAATMTYTDPRGDTWTRLTVTGTPAAGDATVTASILRLQEDASIAGANFYVDKCYLQFTSAGAVPVGWISSKNVTNYLETATEGAIPYIDVADIPGDTEAKTMWNITPGAYLNMLYMSRWSKSNSVRDFQYWSDSTGITDTDRTEDAYQAVECEAGWYQLVWQGPIVDASVSAGNYIALLAMRAESGGGGDTSIMAEYGPFNGVLSIISDTTPALLTENYKLFQSAVISIQDKDSLYDNLYREYIYMKRESGTYDTYVDFGVLMPVDEKYAILYFSTYTNASYRVVIENMDGEENAYIVTSGSALYKLPTGFLGSACGLVPNREQRWIMISTGDSSNNSRNHILANGNMKVTLRYKPQTEFLLP